VTTIEQRTSDDWLASAYLNGTIGPRLAWGLDYTFEQRDFDFTQNSPTAAYEDYVETHRFRPEARLIFPGGLFAGVRGTRYQQQIDFVQFYGELASDVRDDEKVDFWIADLNVGYRLPHRWGSIALDVLNVTDEEFTLYRSSLEERVVPARTVLLSARFASN